MTTIYTAIDGDISDFIDSQLTLTSEFRTDDLRSYLLNEGHDEGAATTAILAWQQHLFRQVDDGWETFELTHAGIAAVEELRARPAQQG